VPPLELIVRGTAMYWFLFLLFRVVMRRDVGSVGIADILLLVLIADASQNAMAGEYRSVSDGMVLVSTIAGWNFAIDVVCYRYPRLRRILEPAPLCLMRDGKLLRRNMRKELISEPELMAKLREEQIDDPAQVKVAFMEADGSISVLKRSSRAGAKSRH
jgi:uncharacterized membrane protein YcaP (DUF421 family)